MRLAYARAHKSMMLRSLARTNHVLLALLVAGGAGVAACGAAPAAPQAPASSGVPLASVALPPPPDLSPVAAPPGLIVTGTLSKPGASLATVHGWTSLPMPQSDQVTELLAGEGLGAILDLDRPIDFAVAVAGSGSQMSALIAVAGGVRDLEAAKAALAEHHKLVPAANGAILIKSVSRHPHASGPDAPDQDAKDDDDDDAHTCELAPAYGAAATRLACAWDPASLMALGPWLTRGATRTSSMNDAHVDLRMAPLKAAIVEERRLFSMLLGTVLGGHIGLSGARDLAQAVGSDLADFGMDVDTLSLDVAMADPGGAATVTLKLGGNASTLGRLATANADRNGPPPAAFWQMPGDSDFVVFDRGIDANELARGRDLVLKALADKLADDGVKDGDRHAIVDALAKIVTSAPTVYASGVDVEAARKALAAEKALPESADLGERRDVGHAAAQALFGWRVAEVDEPAATRIDAVKAITAAWSRPAVLAAYHSKPGARVLAIRSAPLPKGSPLPKDTQRFSIDVPLPDPFTAEPPKGKAKSVGPSKPLSVDVFIVPDGARSWIGVGGDPALVTAKLVASVAGTGDALRGKAELAPMKDAVLGAGGFFTARGMPELAAQVSALGGDSAGLGGADLFDGTPQLPHQGTTPIPFSLTAPAATPGTAVATLQVARGTIDDVLITMMKHGF
jgi:hypothetical protein